jgi:hypothetical protein
VAFNGVVNYESLAEGSCEIMVTVAGQKFVETQTFSAGQVRAFVGLNNPAGRFPGFTYTILHDVNQADLRTKEKAGLATSANFDLQTHRAGATGQISSPDL